MSKSILPYVLSLSLIVPSLAFAVRHDDAPDRATHAAKPRSAKPMSEKEIQKKAAQTIKKVMADEKKKANAALKKLAADEKKSATARKKAEAEEKKALTLSQKRVERAKRDLNTAEKKLDGARKNALKERDKGIVDIEKINKEYPGLDLTGANPKRSATLRKQLERNQEIIRNAFEKLAHFAAKVDTLKTNFKAVNDSHQVLKDQLDAAAKARATAAADEKVAVAKAKADIENAAKTAIANAEASANKLADDLRADEKRAAAAAVKAKEEADDIKDLSDFVEKNPAMAGRIAQKIQEQYNAVRDRDGLPRNITETNRFNPFDGSFESDDMEEITKVLKADDFERIVQKAAKEIRQEDLKAKADAQKVEDLKKKRIISIAKRFNSNPGATLTEAIKIALSGKTKDEQGLMFAQTELALADAEKARRASPQQKKDAALALVTALPFTEEYKQGFFSVIGKASLKEINKEYDDYLDGLQEILRASE